MLHSSSITERTSKKISGSFTQRTEENFRPCIFGKVAKAIWAKPDAVIASIADVSDRAARDYLNGKVPAPGIVIAAIIVEITKRG